MGKRILFTEIVEPIEIFGSSYYSHA